MSGGPYAAADSLQSGEGMKRLPGYSPDCSHKAVGRATRLRVRLAKFVSWAFICALHLLVLLSFERSAKADVSSWLFVGSGVTQLGKFGSENSYRPTLRLATGLGTDPSKPFVIGGLARIDTMFGRGTDLTAALRLADNGFVNGNWGLALDLGAVARYWGPDIFGGSTTLIAGAPWGLQLEIGALLGSHDTQSFSAIFGVDLARLTVYRQSGSSWWKNTFPAVRPESSHDRD